jgi:hypothetical protein
MRYPDFDTVNRAGAHPSVTKAGGQFKPTNRCLVSQEEAT